MSGHLIDVGLTSIDNGTVHTHREGSALDVNHLERYAINSVEAGDGVRSSGVVLHTVNEALGGRLKLAKFVFKN